jgi:predicted ribosome quality control (RQC) complex YloA/Tae2 family protein
MLTNYFTLRALATEWAGSFPGALLKDAYSQSRDECTLALATPEREWMLRISTRRAFPYIFRTDGYNRARRNVATRFARVLDKPVTGIRLADRDRVIFIDFADGRTFQIFLFGPRANVLLVGPDGVVEEAFQRNAALAGSPAPTPVAARRVDSFDDFEAHWPHAEPDLARALSRAMPLFDRDLARETLHRAGCDGETGPDLTIRQRLYSQARALEAGLATPRPTVYWRDDAPEAFTLIPMNAYESLRAEGFETTDRAVAVFVRRRLALEQFLEAFTPLQRELEQAVSHYRQSGERMLEALAQESRADRYEHWAHLLMAQPTPTVSGATSLTAPDLFADQQPVTIPLAPERTLLENARAYYEKARATREARAHAETRLGDAERQASEAERLLERLRPLTSAAEVQQFMNDEADALAPFMSAGAATIERLPFRRFDLGHGYEVWVGKTAQQNDALTFQHARKFDLWMHARGVAGSHAVLRRPGRTIMTPRPLLERAASIAAYFSKARGSDLVPVIVVERKYVRKPRGAAPGAVLVEREEVLIVPPALPQ